MSTSEKHRTTPSQEDGKLHGDEGLSSSTEMGYVLLSECSVSIAPEDSTASSWNPEAWMNVALTASSPPLAMPVDGNEGDTSLPCPHCYLRFHVVNRSETEGGNLELSLCTQTVTRFKATIQEMAHPRTHTGPSNFPTTCKAQQRSDASLLVGAILDAQDHGYVGIQQMKLLVHHKEEEEEDKPTAKNKNPLRASLLVTLAFPSLTESSDPKENEYSDTMRRSARQSSTSINGIKSIVPSSRRSTNPKPLPASVQFLLSIIRSDWGCLASGMQQLQKRMGKQSRNAVFFPPTLSLEELYSRIRGSNARVRLQEDQGRAQLSDTTTKFNELLSMIPMDILKAQIAPFLRAKSLDSLRCSCKGLNQSLQSVVPGLKLRLFRHQIKSLQWMRNREVRPICETRGQEILHRATSEDSIAEGGHALIGEDDSDPVRSMTGGQSAWLCPRWNVGDDGGVARARITSCQLGVRIDQLTGNEIVHSDVLARQGARGGLLCDDPGLGKTITILSLILQTLGVSTEYSEQPKVSRAPRADSCASTSTVAHNDSPEEQMFQAYWREDIPPDFRRPALHRLLARLKKVDAAAAYNFMYKVDPNLDGCEDYFDVIKDPICLTDINKKIAAEEYGKDNSDFNAFVRDVELCFK
jgi:SNF2-related domain/Bromodomain